MSDSRLKEVLSPRDQTMLNAVPGSQWVPRDPIDVLLPYLEKDPPPEQKDLETRLEKARQIYDNYGKIIERCKVLEDEISQQCKNVTVSISPSNNLAVRDAIRRTFGTDGEHITFEMYKICLSEWAKMGNSDIPTGGQ